MPRKYNKREKAAQKKAWLNDPTARLPSNMPYNLSSTMDALSSERSADLCDSMTDGYRSVTTALFASNPGCVSRNFVGDSS